MKAQHISTHYLIKHNTETVCAIPKRLCNSELEAQRMYYTEVLNKWQRERYSKYQYISILGVPDFKLH